MKLRLLYLWLMFFTSVLSAEVSSIDSSKVNDESYVDRIIAKSDISSIWLTNQRNTVGFIGDNYQRLYIHYDRITKKLGSDSIYLVKGKSMVGNNICNFNGEFKILALNEIEEGQRSLLLEEARKDNDSAMIRMLMHIKYALVSRLFLKENLNEINAGFFTGELVSYIYVYKGKVNYYDIDLEYNDSFINNSVIGTWESYSSKKIKKCHWGNFRIPQSGDLDIGAGEFSPNEKYIQYGWRNYVDAYVGNNKVALRIENDKWWIDKRIKSH